MEKEPEESIIVALENEVIDFKIKFPDIVPTGDVKFLLNGNTENVGHVIGIRPDNVPSTSFSTSVTVPHPGEHVVNGIWAMEDDTNLTKFDSLEEVNDAPGYDSVVWKIHAVSESASLDDIRALIDDFTRIGTMVYGGKKIVEKIRGKFSEDPSEGENIDENEDYFQETITNY